MEIIKCAISIIVGFQLVFSPLVSLAGEGPSFDFSDEETYVSGGEDRDIGSENGNCTGSNCDEGADSGNRDDRGDNVSDGQNDRDDGSDSRDYRRDGDTRERSDDPGHGNNFSDQDNEYIEIRMQDSNSGLGFTVLGADNQTYYRGDFPIYDKEGDFVRNEKHPDIYYSRNGDAFVKSVPDGQYLLKLENLKDCAHANRCEDLGYKEDWWNYSALPDFDEYNYESDTWDSDVRLAKTQLAIKKGIERAKAQPSIGKSNAKLKVLNEAEFLSAEASSANSQGHVTDANALIEGAVRLTSLVIDIGISVSPLGWAKDTYEFLSGTSLLDGRELSKSERIIATMGVVMPGVGALAFAGIKIATRNPLAKSGIRNAISQVESVSELLGEMKIARFKEGKSLSEIAIIGRDMGSVREAADRLNVAGIKTSVFEPSRMALDALKDEVKDNGGKLISYNKIPTTEVYREDMKWVQNILDDQIAILDIGNPQKLETPSRFYDDEIIKIFGKENK